jgi:hypothetical protein
VATLVALLQPEILQFSRHLLLQIRDLLNLILAKELLDRLVVIAKFGWVARVFGQRLT